MRRRPVSTTNIAELIAANAGHMIAPFELLYYRPTFFTFPIIEGLLKELLLKLLTASFVKRKLAFRAKLRFTDIADECTLH